MLKNHLLIGSCSLLFAFGLAGCGGSSSGSGSDDSGGQVQAETRTVSGVVRNYYTGEPVSSASVVVTAAGEGEVASGTTGSDGRFSLEATPGLSRVSVNASAAGFGDMSDISATDGSARTDSLELSLLPVNLRETFSSANAASIGINGVNLVEIRANAFVLPDGSGYSGDITSQVTIIDPSSDPGVMPGGYEARGSDGEEGMMESWGAITATFDGADGESLQLRQGESATIRIPLAEGRSASNSPATIPLFFYDAEDGIWREEGSATLVTESGVSFYQGTVTHFTTWNADVLYESVNLSGRVVDEQQRPVANARITSQGQSYIGSSSTRSATDGTFSLPVRPDSSILISASRNTLSNTRAVAIGNEDLSLAEDIVLSEASVAITLTWGENPDDLDSHLFGPATEEGTSEFEVYFRNKEEVVGGVQINLDVDDTDSFGPEVITVPRFPFPGTYRYLVYRYGGTGTIESSPARVEISIDGETRIFSPSQAQGSVSDWWAVADFIVDESGAVSLQVVQEWRDSSDNPVQAQLSPMALGVESGNPNPAGEMVKKKYYAR